MLIASMAWLDWRLVSSTTCFILFNSLARVCTCVVVHAEPILVWSVCIYMHVHMGKGMVDMGACMCAVLCIVHACACLRARCHFGSSLAEPSLEPKGAF